MRTRAEWTAQILADVAGLWAHMDEKQPIESAIHARKMLEASAALLLEGELTRLGEAMAHVALALTMVRETCLENDQKKAQAS